MIYSFLHSCGRGSIKLFLTKEGPTLEIEALELAIDVGDCSPLDSDITQGTTEVVKAEPRLHWAHGRYNQWTDLPGKVVPSLFSTNCLGS